MLLYVVVEKILEFGEELFGDWVVYGIIGYDFLVELNGVFVDIVYEDDFSVFYCCFIGDCDSYFEYFYWGKQLIQCVSLFGEVNVFVEYLEGLVEVDFILCDFMFSVIWGVICEVIVCFFVYCIYVCENGECESGDNVKIEQVVCEVKVYNCCEGQLVLLSVFDYL